MFAMKDGEEQVKQDALVPRDAAVLALTSLLVTMTGRNPPPAGVEGVVDAMISAMQIASPPPFVADLSSLEELASEIRKMKSKGGA